MSGNPYVFSTTKLDILSPNFEAALLQAWMLNGGRIFETHVSYTGLMVTRPVDMAQVCAFEYCPDDELGECLTAFALYGGATPTLVIADDLPAPLQRVLEQLRHYEILTPDASVDAMRGALARLVRSLGGDNRARQPI